MKKTIFVKVFSGYLLIVVALSTLILVFSFRTIRGHHLDTLRENLENSGRTVILSTRPLLEEARFDELDTLVKRLGKEMDTRITIIDLQGVVLADSEKDPRFMENHKTRPEVVQALRDSVGTSLRLSTTVKEEMLYVAMPIEKNGKISGVVRTSLFLSDINSLLNSLKINLAQIALVLIGICLLGALFFARSFAKPIRELSDASQKLASGDFDVRVFLKNKDELKGLASSFNYMADQINRLFTELSGQKEQLQSIISSLEEALLVLDKKGKILLSNESFKKVVQSNLTEGRFYWEVVREPALGDLIRKVRDEKRNLVGEIALADKTFLCSVSPLRSREETVVVLHDVTQVRALEKVKRDFVVNVSHELRTPLTAIKGFAETLEEEADEKVRGYVDVIKRHTDRLINIIRDLLLLSELEEKGTGLETKEVNLKELIEGILPIFDHKLKEKGLELRLETKENHPIIKADPFRLEQMFINLMDNAIKYTEKGGISILLKKKGTRLLTIEITDTGIGIPQEHLSRIFERFYVVDKSRSRRSGGTGLGLSIVKHIVLLHSGTIEVESSLGSGTRFSIVLPISPA